MAPLVRTGGSRHTGLAAPPHRNIHMWDEKNSQDNRGVTFIPVVIGCYNGHWIVKYELIIADDLDKYTSEVFFYDKNGNPWRA